MGKVSSLITIAGWAQTPSTLSTLLPVGALSIPQYHTSTHELLQENDSDQAVFRDSVPSAYAASLSAHLSPTQHTALIATSMGALVALEAAKHFGNRVRKLVFINGTSRFTRHKTQNGTNIPGASRSMLRAMRFGFRTAPRLTLEQFLQRSCEDKTSFEKSLGLALSLPSESLAHGLEYLGKADFSAALSTIEQDTLIIHAECDKIIPPDAGRFMQKTLPNSTFALIPNTGHELPGEHPESIRETILEFLQA